MLPFRFMFTLFVLSALAHSGLCINCYECNTQDTPECGNPFRVEKVLAQDCSQFRLRIGKEPEGLGNLPGIPETTETQTKQVCFKTTIKGKEDVVIIARGCGFKGKNEQCKHITTVAAERTFQVESCDVCEANECNAASRRNIAVISVIMVLLAPILLMTYNRMQ